MAVAQTPKVLYYLESDGEPMAETPEHLEAMLCLIGALQTHFSQRQDVSVAGNQFMYWVEDDPSQRVAPDVYVVFGVPKNPPRPTWKVWEQGKAPDVIMKVSSRSTAPEDFGKKHQIYERLGVKEYFLIDVTREYLIEPVVLYRLSGAEFVPQPCEHPAELEWRAYSELLGLYVVVRWQDERYRGRLFDPTQDRYLPSFDEAVEAYREQLQLAQEFRQRAEEEARRAEAEARRAEEAVRRAEEEARARAEAERRVRELQQELERLKGRKPS